MELDLICSEYKLSRSEVIRQSLKGAAIRNESLYEQIMNELQEIKRQLVNYDCGSTI